MSLALPTWTLRIDRRKASREAVVEELDSLGSSIRDLHIEIISESDYWDAPDAGAFRDFTPLAHISHPQTEALEVVAEELLTAFGWLVDFQRDEASSSEEEG